MKRQAANIGSAILAGGKNRRMKGKNKAFISIDGGPPIIRRTIDTLKEIFEEIFIVTNSPGDYKVYGREAIIITDIIKEAGPLGGIHSALSLTSKEAVFFVACDMPFLHNDIILSQINYFSKINPDFALGFEENGLNLCQDKACGLGYRKPNHCLLTCEQKNRSRSQCTTARTLLRAERSRGKDLETFYQNPNANSGFKCDCLVAKVGPSIEPLHGIYKKSLKNKIESFIKENGDYAIRNFLKNSDVGYFELEDNAFYRNTFRNLNTPEDLKEESAKCK